MDETKATYSINDCVVISTKEYRELIERAVRAECISEEYRTKYFREKYKEDVFDESN